MLYDDNHPWSAMWRNHVRIHPFRSFKATNHDLVHTVKLVQYTEEVSTYSHILRRCSDPAKTETAYSNRSELQVAVD